MSKLPKKTQKRKYPIERTRSALQIQRKKKGQSLPEKDVTQECNV